MTNSDFLQIMGSVLKRIEMVKEDREVFSPYSTAQAFATESTAIPYCEQVK